MIAWSDTRANSTTRSPGSPARGRIGLGCPRAGGGRRESLDVGTARRRAIAHISARLSLLLALMIGAGVPAFPAAIGLGVLAVSTAA
jgi:hypothetical protein